VARTAWTSTDRGRHLSGRLNRDTAPEVALRRALHAVGARFRLHRTLAKGARPDLVLPGRKIAVWVDGCYWHSCPAHGRRTPHTGPNALLWEAKLARTRERDAKAVLIAASLGWTPLRLWECEIRADAAEAASRVLAAGIIGAKGPGGGTSSASEDA
jgi:DNA mismatch endonuclease (patch repair protein)